MKKQLEKNDDLKESAEEGSIGIKRKTILKDLKKLKISSYGSPVKVSVPREYASDMGGNR
ncbi:hypothetical protein JOD43_003013 [Pullulanibacillus pueri]|uniref:Uncharacterized protein n=1 Tax=Pullulanibacillus pueri TaxID=1437324 RepID=A0A8J2ZXD5_9BACL|nr:hypothetical protein [Pullulanibacillus pueri]GGH83377.1 hypothetical protein GCM10007096_24160 [Pullulanibacillus pueri]